MISGAVDPFSASGGVVAAAAAAGGGSGNSPSIPYAPGGAAVATGDETAVAVVCTDTQCGGPVYCLHRVGLAAAASAAEAREDEVRSVVHAHRHYALPGAPYNAPVAPAAAVLASLFRARASVRDLARCGASAEQLALCGLTLDSLTRASYPLRELVDVLQLDWPRAQLLGFHPALLRDRVRFPLHEALLRAPLSLSAARLMEHAPLLSYAELRSGALDLSLPELAALGFTAPLLVRLGARGADVVAECAANAACAALWCAPPMRLSAALLRRLVPNASALTAAPGHAEAFAAALRAVK